MIQALLHAHEKPEWKSKFGKFGVIKFDHNSDVAYNGAAAQVWAISSEKLNIRYY